MLTRIVDYDDLEQYPDDDNNTLSPSSRDFAAFEQYSQDNLPRRVRETFEAMLEEQFSPLEESLKTLLPEVIRTCQAQMFRDWERHSSRGVQDRDGDVSKQNDETKGAIDHETNDVIDHETNDVTSQETEAEPSLPQSAFQDASLSAFYVEPASTLLGSIFENTVQRQFQESEAGRSRTITDSGYASLRPNSDTVHLESLTPLGVTGATNACTHLADLEDPGFADLNFPFEFEFDWNDLPVEHGNGRTEGPETE